MEYVDLCLSKLSALALVSSRQKFQLDDGINLVVAEARNSLQPGL